jgi:CysZ protein
MSSSHALHYIKQGITLVQHKSVRGFVLWPLIINTLLFISISFYAYGELAGFIESWVSTLPAWLSFLSAIIKLLAVLFLMTAAMYTFAIFTTILAAPFYCLVAEKVALLLEHPVPNTVITFDSLWYLTWRSLGRELQKLTYYLPRVLLLLIISFTPIITVISPVLWGLWGAWMMSIQFVDYAADNDMISAAQTRELLGKEKINTLLFGGLIMLGMLVPVLNIILGVIAVAAATAYWCDLHKPTPTQNS